MSDFDLVIVGTGSANSIPGPEFDDWSIAIVERGVFGGTCLNVGCIPSKMFVYAADVADTIATAGSYGIAASFDSADWPAIRDRVFGRIDPIADGGRGYRIGAECPNITVFEGDARFVSDRRLAVRMHDGSTESVSGRHIVLGAGARPYLPPYRGLGTVPFHTSDTVMRIDSLPESMIVLGGGYIACELGYVFSALGTNVTVVNRGERLLRAEDDDVSAAFTSAAERHFDLRLGATVTSVSGGGDTGRGPVAISPMPPTARRVPAATPTRSSSPATVVPSRCKPMCCWWPPAGCPMATILRSTSEGWRTGTVAC